MIIINMLWWVYSIFQGTYFSLEIPSGEFWNFFLNCVSFIGLIIPLGTVKAIFSITVSLLSIRYLVVLIRTVLSIIPLL